MNDLSREEFSELLQGAVAGRHDSLEGIYELYTALINKHCYVNGYIDEDLKQYILIHIALNISKFIF